MKTPREKFGYTFIVLIFISLFLIHLKCKAQTIERYSFSDGKNNIVRKRPIEPMFLYKINDNNDTLETKILSIYEDSINSKNIKINLILLFKNSSSLKYNIKIGFTNGETIVFKYKNPYWAYDYKTSFIHYEITNSQLETLKKCKFDYLEFNSVGLIEPCFNIKTKSFFINFLTKL